MSQLHKARNVTGLILRRCVQQPPLVVQRHFHVMAAAAASHPWPCSQPTPSRNFSVKNRKRKEEKRRLRLEKKAEEEKKQAAGPMVTQTKAAGCGSGCGSAANDDDDDGFILAARPDDEDDEEFESRFSMPDAPKEKRLMEMQTQVSTLYKSGRYQQGLTIALETLEATEDHFEFLHPGTASAYLNVGLFYKQLGTFPEALKHYQKALDIYEETVGKEHESYAMVLHNMGLLYQAQLHFDEQLQATDRLRLVEQALETLEQAYKIRSVELPAEHPHVIATQTALGMTLTSHILSQHKRVSDNKKSTIPDAAAYRSMLPVKVTEESWAAAEAHLRDALSKAVENPRGESSLPRQDKNHYLNVQKKQSLKKKLGTDDQDERVEFDTQTASAATASQNLGVFLKARSTTVDTKDPRYKVWVKEAQELYKKALEVRIALLPKGHPDIYATQHSLAELYDYTGNDKEAELVRDVIFETYFKEKPTKEKKKKKQKSSSG